MSFSDIASGADCGPTNGLQALGKRFGADRSSQQDRYNNAAAGSSSGSSFRSVQPRHGQALGQDFGFAAPQHGSQQQPFDLAPLGGALPFAGPVGPVGRSAALTPFGGHHAASPSVSQQQRGDAYAHVDQSSWDSAFTSYDQDAASSTKEAHVAPLLGPQVGPDRKPELNDGQGDELARTAGRLVSTVDHETSDKFKGSQFLGLMRKLRDRQAGIQGNEIVDQSIDTQSAAQTDKGKGREVSTGSLGSDQTQAMPRNAQEAYAQAKAQLSQGKTGQLGMNSQRGAMRSNQGLAQQGDRTALDEMWAEEDARSEAIEREARERRAGRGVSGAQSAEWDKLQSDWDQWMAGPTGLENAAARAHVRRSKPESAASAPAYRFQADNPYVGTTHTHASHVAAEQELSHDLRSLLEREAAVQADPQDASAWLDLGVKQQENEREGLAIAALHRAIEINPALSDAWLALAVSYTNESDRPAALEATERWIHTLDQYAAVVRAHEASAATSGSENATLVERHARITSTLMAIARAGPPSNAGGAVVDADIQVALGVLFNASEDYDKAVDCFSAALSVRPNDWLLYNRLGATLSNSGRSAEAVDYYHHALELQPGFVRCHFNLSISCLNLKMYRDAASHIYTALTLHRGDSALL
ncbi:TPR repeat-containing protein [Ceraceosorus bombacis]|uniref:TPR repeat-containing protein n=1 Tax=Ceraceosorus bombacis TaxID=401625 RepID=A0A0P1BNB0_9BASI|nr:TPR repeat-containing protein [Ceraceosorus bombacis]